MGRITLSFLISSLFLLPDLLPAADVIVFFRDGKNLSSLDSATTSRASKILSLRANAAEAQGEFLRIFAPHCSKLRSLWLCNAVAATSEEDGIEKMRGFPGVASVVADGRCSLPPAEGGDASPRGEFTYGLSKIGVPEAWKRFGFKGRGVRVGIIDTGCDATHPDLRGKVVAFRDFVNDRKESYDDNGHGTHCAGTIAGGETSGTAIGVAPEAELVIAKGLSGSGSGSNSGLLAAMEWMVDPDGDAETDDGPSIVSNSWGGGPGQTVFRQAVQRWVQLGIFPSFAAGNSGPGPATVGTPGGFLCSFAVGATTAGDGLASFSSRGPVTWDGVAHVKPDLSAPGHDILSARAGGGYKKLSGTSMACPHVSGVIALLHQARPGLTIGEVRRLLEETALDLGASGKDNGFGSGRIDLPRALEELSTKGRIAGRLVDAATNAALAGRIVLEGSDLSLDADPFDGSFFLSVAPGELVLRGEAYGHGTATLPLQVLAGETKTVTLSLRKSPSGRIAGRLVSATSGLPLCGRVRVRNAPLDPLSTDENGGFSFTLPVGRHVLVAAAPGHVVAQSPVIEVTAGTSHPIELKLEAAPPILLVDDGGRPFQRWYREALAALKLEYHVLALDGDDSPRIEDLMGYELVIWYGAHRDDMLGEGERAVVEAYLARGGKLFLTGQNMLRGLPESWTEGILGLRLRKDGVWSRSIEGAGLKAEIRQGDGADNQDSPDGLEAVGDGLRPLFAYGMWSGTAALSARRLAGRVVTAGFGFEAVSTAASRKAVLKAVLDGLNAGR